MKLLLGVSLGVVLCACAEERPLEPAERAALPPIMYVARQSFAPDHHNTELVKVTGDTRSILPKSMWARRTGPRRRGTGSRRAYPR